MNQPRSRPSSKLAKPVFRGRFRADLLASKKSFGGGGEKMLLSAGAWCSSPVAADLRWRVFRFDSSSECRAGPPSVFHNFDWIITRANAVKLHVRLSWCLCLHETQTSPPRRGADLGARCAVLSSSRRRHSAGSRRTDDLIQSATQHLLMRSTCTEQRAS